MKVVRITVAALVAAALVLSVAIPALAWHPEGKIKKEVMNQTAGSALSDANDAGSAALAKPGDVLKYVITVSNVGRLDERGWNDMAKTVMTDTLPAGVELVNNPAQRTITENLGLLKPGASVKKEYLVKVTSQTDGAIVSNEACFTGDSTANDNPQKGCDKAVIKVSVPPKTPEPPVTTTPTPAPPKEVPQVLPSTGPEAIVVGAFSAGALAYGAQAYMRSRRTLLTAHKG
jgi:uncharacterized repeat protein (TIGR01451 family)